MIEVTPQTGTFPPSAPTTMTQTIPSYLYKEYDDDEDLQASVFTYNNFAQAYVNWAVQTPLPVYTDPAISGPLLDWVAEGIYGFTRPSLSSGQFRSVGPYNTYAFNTLPFNKLERIGPSDVTVTTDDVFKRIMTWNFYKGDGNRFNIRWLKRRIMRFLIGENGTAPNIPNTYDISVTFGNNNLVSINIAQGTRSVTGGSLFNRFGFNQAGIPFNTLNTQFQPATNPFPLASVLQQALNSGVLQLPFQYEFLITVPSG